MSLSFDALASEEKDIRYELHSLTKEIEIPLKEKIASNLERWEQINWTIEAPYAPAYVLKVYGQDKLRYIETFRPTPNKLNFRLYPSLEEEEVMIELFEMPIDHSYVLLNARGQKIRTAQLINQHSSLFIGDLPAGKYHLHLSNGNKTLGIKHFVKLQ